MTFEQQTIVRCTRDGRVLWQHVAAQLGVSEATARAQYDGAYRRPYVALVPVERAPKRKAAPKPGSVRDDILRALARGPLNFKNTMVAVERGKTVVSDALTLLVAQGCIVRLPGRQGYQLVRS